MSQRCNAAGRSIIQSCESCKLTAYPDPGCQDGTGRPWTIGWGHTGPEVHEGLVWNQIQCNGAFEKDIAEKERAVTITVRVPLTENQFSALVSFAYNVRGWQTSSLVRLLNERLYAFAAQEFPKWCHCGCTVLGGLCRRRALEQALFLKA